MKGQRTVTTSVPAGHPLQIRSGSEGEPSKRVNVEEYMIGWTPPKDDLGADLPDVRTYGRRSLRLLYGVSRIRMNTASAVQQPQTPY